MILAEIIKSPIKKAMGLNFVWMSATVLKHPWVSWLPYYCMLSEPWGIPTYYLFSCIFFRTQALLKICKKWEMVGQNVYTSFVYVTSIKKIRF